MNSGGGKCDSLGLGFCFNDGRCERFVELDRQSIGLRVPGSEGARQKSREKLFTRGNSWSLSLDCSGVGEQVATFLFRKFVPSRLTSQPVLSAQRMRLRVPCALE